jgi:hypothetical protein
MRAFFPKMGLSFQKRIVSPAYQPGRNRSRQAENAAGKGPAAHTLP